MRAATFAEFGDHNVLTVVHDAPEPEAAPGRVVVEVTHAGVNFAEVMFRRGQFPVGLPHVPGLEAVGTVRSVGEGVTGLRPGQRVAALTLDGGGNAEFVSARAELTVPLEGELAELPSALAAAALCNGATAWGVVHAAARVEQGDTVLVLAAAGGVGTAAAQLAGRRAPPASSAPPARRRRPRRPWSSATTRSSRTTGWRRRSGG
ncbi:alcohol dehydrogenase catalytic domain-containing protein [Streptomyces sp. NPDC051183]|uniref:alcohol dehydrogenase catalytic domain-containing protein n=1 Tax=Streptomyces sp. NPDC051183 TaxID=3155165 RepID=UPI0034447638